MNARVKEFPPQRRHMLPLGSLEWVDFTGQTAFIRAAQSADLPVMRLLLSKGADPKITTFNGTTALMAAAGVNWVVGQTYSESPARWLQAVQLCLELGVDVNARQRHGTRCRARRREPRLRRHHRAARAAVARSWTSRTRKAARRYVWAEGVFLATNSPVAKPSTMALINRLLGERRRLSRER